MYELQVDLVFYDDELVVMVFDIVRWIFSIVVVDIELVGGQLLVVDQQVLVKVDQQVLVNQVVQLKTIWP